MILRVGVRLNSLPADRTIVPGRFRAHAAAARPSRLNPFNQPTTTGSNSSTPSSSSGGPHQHLHNLGPNGGRTGNTAGLTPTKRRLRRLSTRRDPLNVKEQQQANERTWLLRPSRDRVESWLDAWWKRWLVLVIVPSVIVSELVGKKSRRVRAFAFL